MSSLKLLINESPLSINQIDTVAATDTFVELSDSEAFHSHIERSADHVANKKNLTTVYGVNTGVGESCIRKISPELIAAFPIQLSRMHGCGLGANFDAATTRAILLTRIASLKIGFSGVRISIIERLCEMLNRSILPIIPEEGSVGASGDLTPLSYVVATLIGERQVLYKGTETPASEALAAEGLEPLQLNPKESLAIMNGTSVMTAIACLAFKRAEHLSSLSALITALSAEALQSNKAHFDERIFKAKPHPGQLRVASRIASALGYNTNWQPLPDQRIQDTYAIRCAPHVIGVLEDFLPWAETIIETELNSANDNPLIDPETGDILHGGNFYGGHIAMVMDSMKTAIANCADLLDRQFALLVNRNRNRNLPENLSGASGKEIEVNHGLKALQIGASAWTAEALKLTMPASVFSRSTESHNQDKVSMGTIAARDCIRVLQLTEQVAAATLLAATQACELRIKRDELSLDALSPELVTIFSQLREVSPFIECDRALESELREVVSKIQHRQIGNYE